MILKLIRRYLRVTDRRTDTRVIPEKSKVREKIKPPHLTNRLLQLDTTVLHYRHGTGHGNTAVLAGSGRKRKCFVYYRHSVDSVASYSSQNHVDRIRSQNFSARSCNDEGEFPPLKNGNFKRSISNLDISFSRRPESANSNTSSTRSRLRDFVERKSHDDHKCTVSKTGDIEYFENPTETLEFDKQKSNQSGKKGHEEHNKKKRSLKEEKARGELHDSKPRKHEKYQSKLAEYYNLPVKLPQDEFYQHLTRSKATNEELLQKRFASNCSDAEFNESYGKLCKHKENEGSNLRRSRSLAVIREETFTDLQIQNHNKSKRSQLIPRARLFDKPCFKDRLSCRAKYQTKEEALESIYIKTTTSCFGDINDQLEPNNTTNSIPHDKSNKEDTHSHRESNRSKSIEGSWPNLAENISKLYPQLSEDSINYSRNPSEIDSLDSNYVRKHYNFEAHQKGNYKESSPETDRSLSPAEGPRKKIFLRVEAGEKETSEKRELALPKYFRDSKFNTDRSFSNDSVSASNSDKSQTDFNVLDVSNDIDSYEEVSLAEQTLAETKKINTHTITKSCKVEKQDADARSIASENDGTISTPPDSITSYVSISIPSSTEKSRKLEYLTNSLAEKIDEYCESQQRENYSGVSLQPEVCNQADVNTNYTIVNQIKPIKEDSDPLYCKPSDIKRHQEQIFNNGNHVSNIYLESQDTRSKVVYREGGSSKNITTEPFVTTLIENQYYSLPDINISKSLRKSERIDAKLREEDPEEIYCENAYEITHSHFNKLSSVRATDNYGQLNNTYKKVKLHCPATDSEELDIFFNKNVDSCKLQNCSQFEDDIRSIITDSSVHEEKINEAHFELETHQNEKEVNEIEGTIRANKLVVKCDPNKNENSIIKPNFIVGSEVGNIPISSLNDHTQDTKHTNQVNRTGVRKHYSLRQREPNIDQVNSLPNPETFAEHTNKEVIKPPHEFHLNKNNTLLSRVKSFKSSAESNIAIVPLSGHQTIVIDPPITQSNCEQNICSNNTIPKENSLVNETEINNKEILTGNVAIESEIIQGSGNSQVDSSRYFTPKEAFITIKLNKVVKATIPKLKKETSDKIAAVQHNFEKPPARLIINNNKNINDTNDETTKQTTNMTRPQVLQVVDSNNLKGKVKSTAKTCDSSVDKAENINTFKTCNKKEDGNDAKIDIQHYNSVSEKISNAIKTDIEYQEKLHSVKNYWSKLIEKTSDVPYEPKHNEKRISKEPIKQINDTLPATEATVSDLVKSIETVKIVDSIRKSNQAKIEIWKDETEKSKDDSEIEETSVNKIIKDVENGVSLREETKPTTNSKNNIRTVRETPEIEIVELSCDDNKNKVTQATLIKAKSYEKGCDEFDHVRYKVMKSELFKNSMIANYRKEAQFDGLLQYLQDYSFQELLVNNNVVIIEPVRTKVEPVTHKNLSRISPSLLKKSENYGNVTEKSKSSVKRHFFYHPIRVNKEIIEEELPNPDTVKKVRNLFEDTLKMRSPVNKSDPAIVEEPVILSTRSASYRNIIEEPKITRNVCKKKPIRNLTIDTSFGNRKWDCASLSSGVSSGDLSSNNEYETDRMSPYPTKHMRDHVYSSSSEEYLCDSLNPNICYESQYVSQDILKKIRECGTSITYYGGKVLNSKMAPAISPMTKAIMEEIRGLQKNCNRDCYSCQIKCHGSKCACLVADTHKNTQDETKLHSCTSSDSGNQDPHRSRENKRNNSFPGFKFKLVKSNSCSSRLELAGADDTKNPRWRYRNKPRNSMEDPPIIYDGENSVKNKVCRLESYKKGMVDTPFDQHDGSELSDDLKKVHLENSNELSKITQTEPESSKNTTAEHSNLDKTVDIDLSKDNQSGTDDQDKSASDPHRFEKKFYYVNDKIEHNKGTSKKKFGEMVFEEFEVVESNYDSLNSAKSVSK